MGVQWATKTNRLPDMLQAAKNLNGRTVSWGVPGGTKAGFLYGIHEYGCVIPVTPKMRAYLHYQGVHLKADTTMIVIPERSFLRAGYDENRDDVLDSVSSILAKVLLGDMGVFELLEATGTQLRDAIKEYARDLDSPPNAALTVLWKGKNDPLIDSGSMVDSLRWEWT